MTLRSLYVVIAGIFFSKSNVNFLVNLYNIYYHPISVFFLNKICKLNETNDIISHRVQLQKWK